MIQTFRNKSIYQIKIDTGIVGVGVKDICFQVLGISNASSECPPVDIRFALACNITKGYDDIYMRAEHVCLTPIMLFYMDFFVSEEILAGLDAVACHYVKYCTLDGNPIMIRLCLEDGGVFSYIVENPDGTYKKANTISFLDELQAMVCEIYKREFPVRLDAINHARIYEDNIPMMAETVATALQKQAYMSLPQVQQLLQQITCVFENDVRVVVRYGISTGLFKYEPSLYGALLTKV